MTWQAGDIAEMQPANAPSIVADFLEQHGMDGQSIIRTDAGNRTLIEILKYSDLSFREDWSSADASQLKPLLKREFSIASISEDGHLHLVVRQARKDDGSLASGPDG